MVRARDSVWTSRHGVAGSPALRLGAAPARQRAELTAIPTSPGRTAGPRHARVDPASDDTLSGREPARRPSLLIERAPRDRRTGCSLTHASDRRRRLGEDGPRWADPEMARTNRWDRHVVLPTCSSGNRRPTTSCTSACPRQGTRDLGVVDDFSALAVATSRIHLGRWSPDSANRRSSRRWRTRWTRCRTYAWCSAWAGWHEPEYHAFGIPYDHRVGRFEALAIIVPLLRGTGRLRGAVLPGKGLSSPPRPARGRPAHPHRRPAPADDGAAARYADVYDADYHLFATEVRSRFEALDRACAEAKAPGPSSTRRNASPSCSPATRGQAWPTSRRPGVSVFEFGGMRQMARVGTPKAPPAREDLPGGRRPAPDAQPRSSR